MEGFISFIFITVIIIWLIGRIAPFLLKWWIRKKFGNFADSSGSRAQQGNRVKEEDGTIVSDNVKRDKLVDDSVGEYIDYEESNEK
ncbi:MAG: hypothetical protein CVT93_02845 [Bacteroidetes bacterium HGW-Bacteroidetes-10]|jgi:hypothetical protein|nr:MAG: hypothetical protein CVT93_02845 [Bacteroidetes bacterium HGW-Bacteroidetes-10]